MTRSSLPVGNSVQPMAYVDVPQKTDYTGKFITLSPINPQTDVAELYECSHGSDMQEQIWTYMSYGPFDNSLNARSRSAALRLGFKFEGIFRQHIIVKARNRDTAWYSMLDSEWAAIKKNMEIWLYQNPDRKLSLTALNNSN